MAESAWLGLLDVTQLNETGSDRVLLERLARAVAELNLPAAFLERIEAAVAVAIGRAWQHDTERVVQVSLAALVQQAQAGQGAQSWGFFLIEKRTQQTRDRRIEVFLYPDGS
jgi:hypothetical protein